MLDLLFAICIGVMPFGIIAIIYGTFNIIISPVMYTIYKLDGGHWEFKKWFKWWMKSM